MRGGVETLQKNIGSAQRAAQAQLAQIEGVDGLLGIDRWQRRDGLLPSDEATCAARQFS
jgi:hypothetical protein